MPPTVSTAPWWYVAALAGGFTVLGGLITLAGGWLSDWRKKRHELSTRWDKEIVDVAVVALSSIDQVKRLARIELNELTANELGRNVEAVVSNLNRLLLLAPTTIAKNHHALDKALVNVLHAVQPSVMGNGKPMNEALEKLENEVAPYLKAIRSKLRISSK